MGAGEYRGVAGDVGNTRGELWKNFRPRFQELQDRTRGLEQNANNRASDINDIRNLPQADMDSARTALDQYAPHLGMARQSYDTAGTDLGQARKVYADQISDPSKRGYGADTLNQMYAKGADVATSAARNTSQGLNKAAAAGGMGSTGATMRNAMVSGERLGSDLLGANRDVNIANADAQRLDLENATKGMERVSTNQQEIAKGYQDVGAGFSDAATGYGNLQKIGNDWQTSMLDREAEQQKFALIAQEQQQAGLDSENKFYSGTIMPSYDQQLQAYEAANKPGFWGTLKNSAANAMGQWAGPGGATAAKNLFKP